MIVILFNKIIYRCRWLFWRKKFGSYKSRLLLGKKITFKHPECLHFGANVGIGKYSYFLPVTKYAGVNYQPKITIGDRCSIGIRNSFACIHSIEIGDDVLFAGYVHITDHSHGYEEIETPISEQKLICKGGIKIEEQCWLGFGCEVLSGVHIGRHSIVAARSVVTKDVPPYTIVAGNPARIVKQYNFSSKKMGEGKMNKNLVIISGLHLNDNNRGTAALGYGSIAFLREKGYVKEGDELVNFRTFKNPFRKYNKRISVENFWMDDRYWKRTIISVFYLEFWLFVNFHILIPFMPFKRYLNRVRLIAAINGGDGFSDIYGKRIFYSRLPETFMAMRYGIPLIFLPQTLGPFKDINNIILAKKILRYADKVYIRDDKFAQELDSMGVFYERTKDLSFYMKPEIVDIEIKSNSVGINISGLAYSNKFETLAGQFLIYPYLIHKLITCFQQKGIFVYLIPHSYNYYSADSNNDDIEAMQQAYDALDDKRNVYMIKKDLKAPQLKYIISKMNFFVGTRMHANFAAIYTGVPLFGLAYSYKFQGAFEANGVFNSTAIINNINELEADTIVKNIIDKYNNLA